MRGKISITPGHYLCVSVNTLCRWIRWIKPHVTMKHSSNYFKYCSPFCMFTCWNCPQRNNVNTPEFYWNECCTITSLECLFTRSDIKVKRLVPKKKKSFILFIHQLQCGHLQSTSIVPADIFTNSATNVCRIPWTHFVGCRLRPALQTSGCLLLTQTGVLLL